MAYPSVQHNQSPPTPPPEPPRVFFTSQGDAHVRTDAQIIFLYYPIQENKARQIFRKTNIFYLLIRTLASTYQWVKYVIFLEKFGVLCFLVTPVLRFALLLCYRRFGGCFRKPISNQCSISITPENVRKSEVF